MSNIRFAEQAEPATPPAGKLVIFVDAADKKLKQKDSDGVVTDLTSSVVTGYLLPFGATLSGPGKFAAAHSYRAGLTCNRYAGSTYQ